MVDAQRAGSASTIVEQHRPNRGQVLAGHLGQHRNVIAATALGVLLFAAAIVLPLFRQTGTRSWQTIWAEDGFEYFEQARRQGGVGVLFRGYAGYLQLPTRLLAVGSAHMPIHDVAMYLALSASVVAALLAWFIYHVSRGWIESRPVRLTLASLVVLMPVLGLENTANITNVIWIFAAVAPWALVSLRARPIDITLRSIVAFLAATATSLSFLFLPLALGNFILRRTRDAGIVGSVFTFGLAVQGLVMLHTQDVVSPIPKNFLDVHRTAAGIADATGVHVFATFLVGNKGTTTSWLNHYRLLTIGAFVCFCLILTVLSIGVDRNRQILAGVLVAYAVISFVLPAWSRQQATPRYSVIPVFLLASALAILVAPPARSRSQWISRVGRPLFVAQIIVLIIIGFSVTTYRSESPSWSRSVTQAYRLHCVGSSPNKLVEVQTDAAKFWPVTLPCRDLST